jgi:RNA polymerase sigma factor (sigma-70 family)
MRVTPQPLEVQAAISEPASVSFESFFEDEHARLYGTLRLMTRDGHEAEECMQEAFTRVWERWERVREMDDPAGYLYRSAFNAFRSRRRRASVALRRLATATPADPIGQAEQRMDILAALARLTVRQRAALVLVDVVGYTSEEAGAALGIRPSTVRVLAARGRSAMQEGIER